MDFDLYCDLDLERMLAPPPAEREQAGAFPIKVFLLQKAGVFGFGLFGVLYLVFWDLDLGLEAWASFWSTWG